MYQALAEALLAAHYQLSELQRELQGAKDEEETVEF